MSVIKSLLCYKLYFNVIKNISLCHHQNTSKMLSPSLICLLLSGFNNSLVLITYYGKKDCYDLLYKVLFSKDQCKDLVFISKFMI